MAGLIDPWQLPGDNRVSESKPLHGKALAERRATLLAMHDAGKAVHEIADEMNLNERTVRRDIEKAREAREDPPRSIKDGPDYEQSLIMRQFENAAGRALTDCWAQSVANMAQRAAANGDQEWLDRMDRCAKILWSVGARIQRVIKDDEYRQAVIRDPAQRDSSDPKGIDRIVQLGMKAAN